MGPAEARGLSKGEQKGWRDVLLRGGPEVFAKAVREHEGLLITGVPILLLIILFGAGYHRSRPIFSFLIVLPSRHDDA